MKPYMRKNARFRKRLLKTTMFATAIFVAFLFIGSSAAASLVGNDAVNENNNEVVKTIQDPSVRAGVTVPTIFTERVPLTVRGDTFYAYNAYDPTGAVAEGPIYFDSDDPTVVTLLAPTSSPDFIAGACWVEDDETWYGSQYGGGLWIIDETTGAMTLVGTHSETLNGLAYDDSTGTMYGADSTNLYTVDMATGATTLVGSFGISYTMIGIACDGTGNCYGVTVDFTAIADLYSIDMATGAATSIGSTGGQLLYAQDLAFDKNNDILYLAAYFGDGTPSGLYEIDVATGAMTGLGNFPGGMEVSGFAIPYTLGPPPDHDVAVRTIVEPTSGTGSVITPEIEVQNKGANNEYGVPLNVKIGKRQVTGTPEDFEADDGGYTQYGDLWEWGTPTNGPGAAHSGVNVWATDLDGNYLYGDYSLYTPEFTVPTGNVELSFWHWYDTENAYDGGNVKISNDNGVTWTILDFSYSGTANSYNPAIPNEPCFTGHGQGYWERIGTDISAYAGEDVIIRWHFGADTSIFYPGWYVDDVVVQTILWINEYDQTVTFDILFNETLNILMPEWTPADLDVAENVDVDYNCEAELLFTDDNMGNNYKEKEFTLHYGFFHDIGVNDILSPVSGVGATQTPEVEIENFGQNDETGAQVTMTIDEIAYTNQWTQVQYSGEGIWERTDDAYNQPGYGSGFFMVADSDGHNGWTYDVEIFTHSMDMTGETSVDFYCAEYFADLGGDDTAQIGIYSGGVLQETAYYQYGVDDPSGGGVVNYNFDPSGYPDPSDVQIGFYYSTGSGTWDWGFGIDDILLESATVTYIYWDFEIETFPPSEMTFTNVYDETATFDIDSGEAINVLLPDWTPVAPLSDIDYRVTACTSLTNDNNTDNDCLTEYITLRYLHDVGTDSIIEWPGGTRDMWDVQLFVDVGGQQGTTGLVGAEFDGTYFYNCQFNSPNIFRYDADGNYVDTFTIPGVDTIIDMAYDGTYMYGASANNANAIFEMDMDSETLVSTITTSALCWNIAYNEDSDTFYVGQWSNGFYEIDRSGAILNNLAIPESMLGIAYDNGLDVTGYNGPFLWIFTGTSTGLDGIIKLYDLDTQALVPGYDHNVDADLGPCIAGGLFFTTDFISGKATLGGMAQGDVNDYLFCYEMYDVSGGGGNTYEPGTYPVEGIIKNYGTYTEVNFNVHAEILDENKAVFWEDDFMVTTSMDPDDTQLITFGDVTFDEIAEHEGEYDLVITTELVGDEMPANDDESWTFIISIYDDIPPETTHDITGTMGDNDWYVSDVTITLTADDPWPYISPSGVNNTYYSFDSDTGPWEEYTTPIIVDEDGEFEFWYYSDDYNGNVEDVNGPVAFKRDATPPTIDLAADGSGGTWIITATVNDDTSGIAKVEFYVNDEFLGEVTSEPYEWEYTGASSGDIAQAIAYDNAGNSKVSDTVESFNNMQSQSNPVQRVQR